MPFFLEAIAFLGGPNDFDLFRNEFPVLALALRRYRSPRTLMEAPVIKRCTAA